MGCMMNYICMNDVKNEAILERVMRQRKVRDPIEQEKGKQKIINSINIASLYTLKLGQNYIKDAASINSDAESFQKLS